MVPLVFEFASPDDACDFLESGEVESGKRERRVVTAFSYWDAEDCRREARNFGGREVRS